MKGLRGWESGENEIDWMGEIFRVIEGEELHEV